MRAAYSLNSLLFDCCLLLFFCIAIKLHLFYFFLSLSFLLFQFISFDSLVQFQCNFFTNEKYMKKQCLLIYVHCCVTVTSLRCMNVYMCLMKMICAHRTAYCCTHCLLFILVWMMLLFFVSHMLAYSFHVFTVQCAYIRNIWLHIYAYSAHNKMDNQLELKLDFE